MACDKCGINHQPEEVGRFYPGESEYVPHKTLLFKYNIKGSVRKALQIHYNYPAGKPFGLGEKLMSLFKL
jgi:hypothetical protein